MWNYKAGGIGHLKLPVFCLFVCFFVLTWSWVCETAYSMRVRISQTRVALKVGCNKPFDPILHSQTGPCVLIRWPRYIYFPMDECTHPIRSILIIRPQFGAIHLYTEKQDKTQKVWLMFLCPKNILQRFNLPSWHFWKTIIIGNQISSFVEKHATHLKGFSFQIV